MKKTIIAILMGLFAAWQSVNAADANTLLQKALFEEEANQNLDAAIKAYQSVIQQTEEQRKLAATAVFRLGECYRKLGRTNEAIAQYERLIANYADQPTLVNWSRQNLAGLGVAGQPESTTAMPSASEEDLEIERLTKLIKESPDLLNAHTTAGSPLRNVAAKGQLKVAEFLLQKGVDINAVKDVNMSPLHAASVNGKIEMVEFLLAHGANVNSKTRQGFTPLHLAVEKGYLQVVKVLLAHKADVNATISSQFDVSSIWEVQPGGTALHVAARKGFAAVTEALLKAGANAKATDVRGRTPLHYAALSGEDGVAKILLGTDVDPNALDIDGYTPLLLSINSSRPEVVEVLASNKKVDVNAKSGAPLLVAAELGQFQIVEILLKNGATVDARDINGYTSLLKALNSSSPQRVKITETLLAHGADVNAVTQQHWSALHIIASRDSNQEALAKLLLTRKPKLGASDSSGQTPLHVAMEKESRVPFAKMLIEAGADVNSRNAMGWSPLFMAVSYRNLPAVQLLLDHKADVNLLDNQKRSPLDMLNSPAAGVSTTPGVYPNRAEIEKLLLDAGATNSNVGPRTLGMPPGAVPHFPAPLPYNTSPRSMPQLPYGSPGTPPPGVPGTITSSPPVRF